MYFFFEIDDVSETIEALEVAVAEFLTRGWSNEVDCLHFDLTEAQLAKMKDAR